MELVQWQERLRAFAEERNWGQFHTPKNLSMALMVEAAELMELFQWKTPDESRLAKYDSPLRMRIGEEVADVLLYLLQLADHTGVDIQAAVEDKLVKNAQKYPLPGKSGTSQVVVGKTEQTHVLVDWENVQPKDVDIRSLVSDITDVWIFHGPNQKKVGENQKSFGDAVTLVPISRTGKNSLDFHLSFYMGYITSRNPDAKFIVISNDQGYGPMLEHAKDLGFAASQIGFKAVKAAPRKTPAKKAPVKKATGSATAAVPAKKAVAPKKTAQAPAKPVLPKAAVLAQTSLAKPASNTAPAKVKTSTTKTNGLGSETPSKKAAAKKVTAPNQPRTKGVVAKGKEGPVKEKSSGTTTPISTEDKVYTHVLASLRKSKNKPTRKVRLYGAVRSLLKGAPDDDASVEKVVTRLLQEGHLEIDDKGAVTKAP